MLFQLQSRWSICLLKIICFMETFREIKISLKVKFFGGELVLAMIHYVENLMDCLSIQKNYHQTPLSLTANTIRLLGSKFVQINIAPCSSRQSA